MAYEFLFGELPLPVAPSRLQLKIGNKNKTYTLIDGTEINVLKSPKLTEISFDLMIPAVQYGFAVYKNNVFKPAEYFIQTFEGLKTGKHTFQFIVNRKLPNGKILFDTNMKVSLEDYTIKEDVKEGFDAIISVRLKQYVDYKTKICDIQIVDSKSTVTVNNSRSTGTNAPVTPTTHTVKKGDTLWGIAKKYYGKGSKYTAILEANRGKIKNPSLIYAGQKLTIPDAKKI